MGIAYNPIWVEFPMFYEGNPLLMETGPGASSCT